MADIDFTQLLTQNWVVDGVSVDPTQKLVADNKEEEDVFFGDGLEQGGSDEFPEEEGGGDDMADAIGFKGKDTMHDTVVEKRNMNPKDRWLFGVREAIQELGHSGVSMSKEIADEITQAAEGVGKYEFINPVGFVVGRLSIDKGVISKKHIDSIYKKIPNQTNKADIVRYARFWINNVL